MFCDASNNSTVNIFLAQAGDDIGKGLRRKEPSMTRTEVACFEGYEVRNFMLLRKTVALFMDFLNPDGNNFLLYLSFKVKYLNKVMSLKR